MDASLLLQIVFRRITNHHKIILKADSAETATFLTTGWIMTIVCERVAKLPAFFAFKIPVDGTGKFLL